MNISKIHKSIVFHDSLSIIKILFIRIHRKHWSKMTHWGKQTKMQNVPYSTHFLKTRNKYTQKQLGFGQIKY